MTSRIPKQLYVVAKPPEWETDYKTGVCSQLDEPSLGFMHEFSTGASFKKKQLTQFNWAYDGYFYDFDKLPSVFQIIECRTKCTRDEKGELRFEHLRNKIDAPFQPTIWDNEPLSGFRVLKSVKRSTTSNKLWRIVDPRGLQFEITTASMEDLLEQTTISKNLIHGECVWGSGKNLIFTGA